jgi:two-component system, chemotaxis family, protein-glutamate methylesterase/glutaminase
MASHTVNRQKRSAAPSLGSIEAILMGGSAGALAPILELVHTLPAALRQPLIVVFHLPERGEGQLPAVLQQRTRRPVLETQDKQKIEQRNVYVVGASYHVSIEQDRSFSLSDENPMNFSRPSIDVLFHSAADVFGKYLAAFLFSGASDDGAKGLAAIHKAGGLTVVQSPEDAAFAAMPRAAIRAQQPHHIMTCGEMRVLLGAIGEMHTS